MPFAVEIHLPELEAAEEALAIDWLVPVGQYAGWETPLLRLSIAGKQANLVCNMPVVVFEQTARLGEAIHPGKLIARVKAEGDEIPYGRPYARIEFIA